MPSNVKHQFVSGKSDGADATVVRPSDWNAAHTFNLTNGSIPFVASNDLTEDTANLIYDAGNDLLKIGGGYPAEGSSGTSEMLHVGPPGSLFAAIQFLAHNSPQYGFALKVSETKNLNGFAAAYIECRPLDHVGTMAYSNALELKLNNDGVDQVAEGRNLHILDAAGAFINETGIDIEDVDGGTAAVSSRAIRTKRGTIEFGGGPLSMYNSGDLAAESLTNGALTSGTSWSAAGDFALANDQAEYTHSSGSGTLTQTSGNLAIAGVGNYWYKLTYTISSATNSTLDGQPTGTLTTAFSNAALPLDLTNGTHTVYFKATAAPGNFVISVTSDTGDTFDLDTLSLKRCLSGEIEANGGVTMNGVMRLVQGVVVGSLPTPAVGMIARVTDATAPAVGVTVVGGGGAAALVWYNGSNWTVIGV